VPLVGSNPFFKQFIVVLRRRRIIYLGCDFHTADGVPKELTLLAASGAASDTTRPITSCLPSPLRANRRPVADELPYSEAMRLRRFKRSR